MSSAESVISNNNLKKKRLSANPFVGLNIPIQILEELSPTSPRTQWNPIGNLEDLLVSPAGGKRYSYLIPDANRSRVLKPLVINCNEELSNESKRTSVLSSDLFPLPIQSFNRGHRVSTFLNLASISPISPSRLSMNSTALKSPIDSCERENSISTTSRPSMRSFRRATYVLQKMSEAGEILQILPEAARTSQNSASGSVPRNSQSTSSKRNSRYQSFKDQTARKDHGSIFVTALLENVLSRPNAAENEVISPNRTIPTPPPYIAGTLDSIDYTHIFPDKIGETEGTFVFRIEAMKPVLIDQNEHGFFCIADSYIIMESTPKDPTRPDSDLTHSFYTWIGGEAETDKRFCCAMYAVALRNLVGANTRIEREIPGDESDDFLRVFILSDGSKGIRLLDASHATDSGLYSANAKQYPIKLYRIDQKSSNVMFLVEKRADTLSSNHVYLLDAGMEIYQWNGLHSTLQNRSKARMIAERVNKQERVGRAEYVECDEKCEPNSFWEALQYEEEPTEEDLDEDFPISTNLEQLQLYRVFPKLAPDLESHIVASGKIKKELLVTDGIYILDAGTELSLWVGKKAWSELKEIATNLLRIIAANKTRPSWIAVNKYVEGAEPESFKIQFCNWQEKAPPLPPTPAKKKDDSPNVDAILTPYTLYPADAIDCEDTMEIVNSFLETFSSFVYYRGKFIALPEEERGHFFEQDAYVFLCVYRAPESQLDAVLEYPLNGFDISDLKLCASESVVSSESEDVTLSCVIYFCQSRKTSRVPYSNFKLTTQKEMEELVKSMYKCPLQVKLVDYGMEPFALLSHLENSYILHSGSRMDRLAETTGKERVQRRQYQIRTDVRYQTTRTVQIDIGKSSLVSRDCFFFMNDDGLEDGGSHVLWRGDDFDRTLLEFAVEPVKKILRLYGKADAYIDAVKDADIDAFKDVDADEDAVKDADIDAVKDADIDAVKDADIDALKDVDADEDAVKDAVKDANVVEDAEKKEDAGKEKEVAVKKEEEKEKEQIEGLPPNVKLIENSATFSNVCPKGKDKDKFKDTDKAESIPLIIISSESPKMFFCSCNHGFFKVERYAHFHQKTLSPESCIMLDPGSDFPLFVWIGSQCSDTIRKLVLKSAMMWLNNCQDGRRFTATSTSEPRMRHTREQSHEKASIDYSIRIIDQGSEPPEFKAYFLPWDSNLFRAEEPGNLFTRTQGGKQGWQTQTQTQTHHL